ncbi:nitric oxide synthase oxygenase [Nonomuraea guangzhouensis]|uniref:Nitric oxide synthase oxygenase n=1 Tax=Nonomuraea guangzhouensis TaxID=1291555 RepID=A0ABW4G7X4_9ACTN|nr:nitric oxide synthase oxygenase [Nonomuraea guangzhouensis]
MLVTALRTWIRSLRPFDAIAVQTFIEHTIDIREAERFIRLFHAENPSAGDVHARLREVARDVARHGTYVHTFEELQFGARVAWRNSSRCIGRLYWRSLRVRDRRQVHSAEGVAIECVAHLRAATGDGRIRPTVTVFPPDTPARRGPRVLNEQLIRYAGHRLRDGSIVGDPRHADFTTMVRGLGWRGGEGRFDVLPLVIQPAAGRPLLCNLPGDAVLEVPLTHPEYPWFAELGLRWHAVPAISGMCLEIGGLCYPCAPFNGWYMGAEIGARNLADVDRYDQLPVVAERLRLNTATDRSLWRDHALVELNVAVLHSFEQAGVTMTDHHTESNRFLTHLEREEKAGRVCPADWSWIVPPISGGATRVFHRYYDNPTLTPAFVHHSG